MGKAAGYWIHGNKIKDVTYSTHVDDIIKMPEVFGLSKEDINKQYAAHGERVGAEGKAREELILKVLDNGWVRVRHYTSGSFGDYWSVQFDEISKREKAVKNFLSWAVHDSKIMHPNDDVRLVGFRDNYYKEIRGVGDYLHEEKIEKGFLKLVESLKEMLPD
jgi:hypothetical protein